MRTHVGGYLVADFLTGRRDQDRFNRTCQGNIPGVY